MRYVSLFYAAQVNEAAKNTGKNQSTFTVLTGYNWPLSRENLNIGFLHDEYSFQIADQTARVHRLVCVFSVRPSREKMEIIHEPSLPSIVSK